LRDERETDNKKPPRTVLVMEAFDPDVAPEQLVARMEVVGRHAASALYNATEHKRIPFRWIWMPLARLVRAAVRQVDDYLALPPEEDPLARPKPPQRWAGVEGWHVGDRVCALVTGGGYAEYCVAPAPQCLPVPDGMDVTSAAAIPAKAPGIIAPAS
jgi:hypothetical protein